MKLLRVVGLVPMFLASCVSMDQIEETASRAGFGDKSEIQDGCFESTKPYYYKTEDDCKTGELKKVAKSRVAEIYAKDGRNAAMAYCNGEYVDTYGKYHDGFSTELIDHYPVDQCLSDVAAQVAVYDEEARKNAEAERKRQEAEQRRERDARKRQAALAEQKRQEREVMEKAFSLVSLAEGQAMARQIDALYRQRQYTRIVTLDDLCWSAASSRVAVAKCGVRTLAGFIVSGAKAKFNLGPMIQRYATPNLKSEIVAKIASRLSTDTASAEAFYGQFVFPHATPIMATKF